MMFWKRDSQDSLACLFGSSFKDCLLCLFLTPKIWKDVHPFQGTCFKPFGSFLSWVVGSPDGFWKSFYCLVCVCEVWYLAFGSCRGRHDWGLWGCLARTTWAIPLRLRLPAITRYREIASRHMRSASSKWPRGSLP